MLVKTRRGRGSDPGTAVVWLAATHAGGCRPYYPRVLRLEQQGIVLRAALRGLEGKGRVWVAEFWQGAEEQERKGKEEMRQSHQSCETFSAHLAE